MADELNIPTHRWYEPRNHIALPKEDVSKQWIFDSGIQKIDAFINAQPWGNPIVPLFALNEPGVWYDPSDLTTMFQDRAGTTPVTAPGQTVGYVLDKSGRGNHLTANSDAARGLYGIEPLGGRRNLLTYTEQFDNAAWGKTTATVTANAAVAPNGTTTADEVEFTSGVGGFASIATFVTVTAATHTQTIYVKAFPGQEGNTVTFDNSGATGTVTITLTSDWQRVSKPVIASAGVLGVRVISYPGNTASRFYVWGAQLELGSTATDYQRVVTALEVTEAGKPSLPYILFDGADDGYVTPTITPGTDKAQVFAGVRKLSDAALAMLFETSTNAGSLNGAIYFLAPHSNGQGTYQIQSKGTATGVTATSPNSYPAPITSVLTGTSDIAGDLVTLRINGAQIAQATGDQGTGNYLAYPLYVGRRGGTTLPFNGRLYSLIVRFGPNLDAARISEVERFVNTKTGAF